MNHAWAKRAAAWGGAMVLIASFLLVHWFEASSGADPDRYFHFALSRQMVESGKWILRELPQIEGLGWNRFFMEKEFLFHQFTAMGYRLGGEGGIVWASLFLALSGILAFYAVAVRRAGVVAAFLVTGIFFGSPMILSRLLMVRPHVLAIACFILMLAAAIKRSRYLFSVSVFLFVLSYHAFYIPLLVMGTSFAASFLVKREFSREERAFYLSGVAALVAGIVINPYFPANLVFGIQIAMIPSLMSGKLSMVGFGAELYPISSDIFIASFSVPLIVFLALIWRLSRDHRRDGVFFYANLFLAQMLFLCLLMTFQSRRGAEYLLPAAGFAFLELWATFQWKNDRKVKILALLAALLIIGWHTWVSYRDLSQLKSMNRAAHVQAALDAVASLPADRDAKVFNCEWDFSPYLFYSRPKMRFLDTLDPSLLYFSDEPAHNARNQLMRGEVGDPYGLLKNAFKADYVYCRNPTVVSVLERDPRFRRLFPEEMEGKRAQTQFFVYELRTGALPEYVKSFKASLVPATTENFRSQGPDQAEATMLPIELTFSGYADLASVFKDAVKSGKEGQAFCALVRPSRMEELAGATYLSLGGGRNLRVWKNGKPLFESGDAYLQAGMHQQVVSLGAPLKASDRLDFVVCSAREASFWGLSVLGLTETTFGKLCEWKRSMEAHKKEPFAFPLKRRGQSCLGDIAIPKVPRSLR
jgi:hypothetical protein